MFQYNYCFGGTEKSAWNKLTAFAFQYNYCFGGTFDSKPYFASWESFNTTIVSVEPFKNLF